MPFVVNKKAALELSITAVVSILIAVIFLGLALVFLVSTFSESHEEFAKTTDIVDKQFIEQLKTTDKTVAVDRPKVEIKPADADQIFIAFRNKDTTTKTFTIDASTSCTRIGPDPLCTGVTIEYKATPTDVQSGDVTVQPINIKVDSAAAKGTYIWDIRVDATSSTERIEVIVDVV